MRALLFFMILGLCVSAKAEENSAIPVVKRVGPYLGVAPGSNDLAPNKADLRSVGTTRLISWVGFQMAGPGGRVFIQSTEPLEFDIVSTGEGKIVIDLANSFLHSSNDGRRLETGWFPTAVLWVEAKQHSEQVTRVTIRLREEVGYDVRQQGNYLFFDFRAPQGPVTTPAPTTTPPG